MERRRQAGETPLFCASTIRSTLAREIQSSATRSAPCHERSRTSTQAQREPLREAMLHGAQSDAEALGGRHAYSPSSATTARMTFSATPNGSPSGPMGLLLKSLSGIATHSIRTKGLNRYNNPSRTQRPSLLVTGALADQTGHHHGLASDRTHDPFQTLHGA